jgi:molecular chaperone GrpE (heat shock protein)
MNQPTSQAQPAGAAPKEQSALAVLRQDTQGVSRMLGELAVLLRTLGGNFETIGQRFDQYSVRVWEFEKAAEERFLRLANSLLLAIDYLEFPPGQETVSDEAKAANGFAARRIRAALQDSGIERIPVKAGEPFDGERHHGARSAAAELPAQSIVEVVRPGYWLEGPGGTKRILRPAVVVVSTGPEPAPAPAPAAATEPTTESKQA